MPETPDWCDVAQCGKWVGSVIVLSQNPSTIQSAIGGTSVKSGDLRTWGNASEGFGKCLHAVTEAQIPGRLNACSEAH